MLTLQAPDREEVKRPVDQAGKIKPGVSPPQPHFCTDLCPESNLIVSIQISASINFFFFFN